MASPAGNNPIGSLGLFKGRLTSSLRTVYIFLEMVFSANKIIAKIRVQFYSGYKGEETPRSVTIDGEDYEVEEILARKRIMDIKTGKTYESLTCRTKLGILKIEGSETGEWTATLLKPDANENA